MAFEAIATMATQPRKRDRLRAKTTVASTNDSAALATDTMITQPPKRIRLRAKTSGAWQQQPRTPLVSTLADYQAGEMGSARKAVYLITFPRPQQEHSNEGIPLTALRSLTREALLEKIKSIVVRGKSAHCDGATIRRNHGTWGKDAFA